MRRAGLFLALAAAGCASRQAPAGPNPQDSEHRGHCGISGLILFQKPGRSSQELAFVRVLMRELMSATSKRGKDATGFVVINRGRPSVLLKLPKSAPDFVKLPECEEHLTQIRDDTTVIISHNHAANVGMPSNNENNMPLRAGPIWLVHNGTIMNHMELFGRYGFPRQEEVDSEIIVRLIDHYSKAGITTGSLKKAFAGLEGGMALAFADERDPNRLYLVRDLWFPMSYVTVPDLDLVIFDSELGLIRDAWKNALAGFPDLTKVGFRDEVELPDNTGVVVEADKKKLTRFDAPVAPGFNADSGRRKEYAAHLQVAAPMLDERSDWAHVLGDCDFAWQVDFDETLIGIKHRDPKFPCYGGPYTRGAFPVPRSRTGTAQVQDAKPDLRSYAVRETAGPRSPRLRFDLEAFWRAQCRLRSWDFEALFRGEGNPFRDATHPQAGKYEELFVEWAKQYVTLEWPVNGVKYTIDGLIVNTSHVSVPLVRRLAAALHSLQPYKKLMLLEEDRYMPQGELAEMLKVADGIEYRDALSRLAEGTSHEDWQTLLAERFHRDPTKCLIYSGNPGETTGAGEAERRRRAMTSLALFYMLQTGGATYMERFGQLDSGGQAFTAFRVPLGRATEKARIYQEATGEYEIWGRAFGNALVLWSLRSEKAAPVRTVKVALPAVYRALQWDATLGEGLNEIVLDTGDSAILMRD
jgi:hypothetical protein